jgi:hypothetical protein
MKKDVNNKDFTEIHFNVSQSINNQEKKQYMCIIFKVEKAFSSSNGLTLIKL